METCPWCGGEVPAGGFTETCPRSVACPTCDSGPGSPCYRPSGHRAPQLHATRLDAAAALDVDRDLFGNLTVPAPELPGYMTSRPRAEQVRLFEPQMEGQLTLDETTTGDLTVPE